MRKKLLFPLLLPLLWACDDSTGPEGARQVVVRFNAGASAGATAAQLGSGGALFDHVPAARPITLTGSNGTLVIQDIRLIVSEIELERAGGECAGGREDDCEDFEGGPFLVNLLDGTAADVVSASIPPGSYTEFEFEVEALESDEDDNSRERQALQSIMSRLRQDYPAFPADASMVVHGTFNGQPFTVYFAAEIEVEEEFAVPFRVPEDGAILVNLDPASWFRSGNQVTNLLALNGRTVEFEAEFERGVRVEHD